MARSVGIQAENNFIRGLITEATSLNFPENAVTATDNCKFDRTGLVTRRLGIDAEQPFSSTESPGTAGVVREYNWKGVGQEGDRNFLVVQFGEVLSFFEPDSSGNYSGNGKSFSVALVNYLTPQANRDRLSDEPCSFASGNGVLFVAHGAMDPIFVKYNDEDDTITTTEISLQIRDVQGLEEPGVEVNERPTTLTEVHKYNLLNQGFAHTDEDHFEEQGLVFDLWAKEPGYPPYPSNADIPWFWRNEKDQWDGRQVDRGQLGNSPAPRGYYILDAFNLNRADAVEPDFTVDIDTVSSEGERPTNIAFFAGRVWYAGVNSDGFRQDVYFSKVVEAESDYGKCYQINDPTSVELSDLLDTDGGKVKVLDMGQVHHMQVVGNRLYMFSTQGVWSIGGSGEGTSFVATDFAVQKHSDVPALSGLSFVSLDGTPMWWNLDGIYTFQSDATGLNFSVVSVSRESIDDFFIDNIPADSRIHAKGSYDRLSKTVQWVFRSTTGSTIAEKFEYDRILVLDTVSGAFYPWTVDTTIATICGIFSSADTVIGTSSVVVTDSNLITVADSGGSDVTVNRASSNILDSKHKYLTCTPVVQFDYGSAEQAAFTPGTTEYYEDSAAYGGGNRSAAFDFTNRKQWVWLVDGPPVQIAQLDLLTMTQESSKTLPTGLAPDAFGSYKGFMQYDETSGLLFISGKWPYSGGTNGIQAYNYVTNTYPNVNGVPAPNNASLGTGNQQFYWWGITNYNGEVYLIERPFPQNAMYCYHYNTATGNFDTKNSVTSGSASRFIHGKDGEVWINDGTNMKKYTFTTSTGFVEALSFSASNFYDASQIAYISELDDFISTDGTDANRIDAADGSVIWDKTLDFGGNLTGAGNGQMWRSQNITRFSMANHTAGFLGVYSGATGDLLCNYGTFDTNTDASWHEIFDDASDSTWPLLQNQQPYYSRNKFCSSTGADDPLITATGEGILFAEEIDTTYVDWKEVNNNLNATNSGADFTSFFTTGQKISGNLIANFQSNYVTVFSNAEANSSCIMNGRFDFSNDGDSGEWSTPQEVYSTVRSNRLVQRRRLKVRGHGPALNLHFTSTSGKPFNIIGWAAFVSANSTP